jgi:hypothetical protein
MIDHLTCQLITIILLKHLNRLNALWEDEAVANRMDELDGEYTKTLEYQEFRDEYLKLYNQIHDTDDKEQRNEALFELDNIVGNMVIKTEKFHYLAGFHDAMQVLNVS